MTMHLRWFLLAGLSVAMAGMTACCLHPTLDLAQRPRLAVLARHTVAVNSSSLWNDAGLQVKEGEQYEFSVSNHATWKDWYIQANADGYSLVWLTPLVVLRRHVAAPWFSLICTVDYRDAFKVFDHSPCFGPKPGVVTNFPEEACSQLHHVGRNGSLFCYANDLSWMYGNNSGSVLITIKRIK